MNTDELRLRNWPLISYLCLSVFIGGSLSASQIPTLLIDQSQLAALKEKTADYQHLLKEAGKIAKRATRTVTHKKSAPPSGDKRDYMTLAPYWFPDPAKPDGLPYLRKDGKVNPESEKDSDADRLVDMSEDVVIAAQAYHLGRDEKHAAAAARHLRAFFLDPVTGMNPHARFGQIVRGRTNIRGEGILQFRHLIEITDAVRLIEPSESWTDSDQAAMNRWLAAYQQWMETSDQGIDERDAKNNHGSWYAAQYVAICLHLNQTEKARAALEQVKSRIASQITPDGTMPLEMARTKSLDYHIFNLRALFLLAAEGEIAGVDLWHFTPPTFHTPALRTALDLLAPHIDPKTKWPGRQISKPKREQLAPLLQKAALIYRHPPYAELARKVDRD